MRKKAILVSLWVIILTGGCANSPSKYLGNNRYQVNVKGFAGSTASSTVAKDWNNAAANTCQGRPYDIITRFFTGPLNNGMEGVIECKQINE